MDRKKPVAGAKKEPRESTARKKAAEKKQKKGKDHKVSHQAFVKRRRVTTGNPVVFFYGIYPQVEHKNIYDIITKRLRT
jgi:hypothetical protein